jgi:succinoglycan biosynthesis protein ExoA
MSRVPSPGNDAESAQEEALPFVSVIVPVRNEAGFLTRCLAALSHQDYPRDLFEVIVLDGESTDATAIEAEEAARTLGAPDIFLTNQGRTTAKGFNLGLVVARGDVIVKVDGHTMVAPDFLSAGVEALRRSGADAVGGPIETVGEGPVGEAIALAQSSRFGIGDAAFRYAQDERWTDSVAFGAYRREVFEKIGRFAEDIDRGEDDEFNYRLGEAGGRILLTPAIRSRYSARSTLGGLWRQYWSYGLAKARVLQRHPRRLRWRHLVPSAFVSLLGLTSLLGYANKPARRLAFSIAGGYLAANLSASVFLAAGRDAWRRLPLLPVAFATIHVAAGAGFIAGWLLRLKHGRSG